MKTLKTYGYFLATILCLLCFSEAYSMSAFKQRFNTFTQNFSWKKAAAVGFAGLCSLEHVRLATRKISPTIFLDDHESNKLRDEEFEKLPDVLPEIEVFVKEHLKNCGVTELKNLKIKEYIEWGTETTKNHTWFFVPASNKLQLSLDMPKKIDDEIKKYLKDLEREAIASVYHEGGHIKNKDNEKLPAITLGCLAANAAISFGVRKKFIPKNNYWFHNLAKIISGMTISNANLFEYYQFKKYCELKADDNVQNNVHILKAAKNIFERDLRKKILYGNYYGKFSSKNFYSKHPHPETRIKRFKKRIKALKVKSDPKAFEDPLAVKEEAQLK